MSAATPLKPIASFRAAVPDCIHSSGFGGVNGAHPRSRITCTLTDSASSTAMAAYSPLLDGRRSKACAVMSCSLEITTPENGDRRGQESRDVHRGVCKRECDVTH